MQGALPSTRFSKRSQSAVTSENEAVAKANVFSSTETCALDNRGPHKSWAYRHMDESKDLFWLEPRMPAKPGFERDFVTQRIGNFADPSFLGEIGAGTGSAHFLMYFFTKPFAKSRTSGDAERS